MSSPLTKPFASYPHTRRVGPLVFLAGQGCRDPETDEYAGTRFDREGRVESYDIAAQTRGVLQNMQRALEAEGLSAKHLVDVTVFLTDMADFPAMNEVWNEFFRDMAPPTRTTVCVTRLPGHNFVEMKGIAAASEE